MKKEKCLICKHGLCPSCGGCHNIDCASFADPNKVCWQSLSKGSKMPQINPQEQEKKCRCVVVEDAQGFAAVVLNDCPFHSTPHTGSKAVIHEEIGGSFFGRSGMESEEVKATLTIENQITENKISMNGGKVFSPEKGWEEEFDVIEWEEYMTPRTRKEVKDFISEAISSAVQDERNRIQGIVEETIHSAMREVSETPLSESLLKEGQTRDGFKCLANVNRKLYSLLTQPEDNKKKI